ncbi:MFS general substrate transporter, partial [Aulographum hederae CBS 113979]
RSSPWFIQLSVGMAVFTDIFLYAVIVPVMPFALKTKLNMDEEDIQSWVSTLIAVYGGALALVSPLCGWVADHTSNRRTPLILGLFALAGATLLLHLGPNIAILVLGRVLQGISAAVVWVVGLAILVDTVPAAELGQAMGLVFFAMSIGVLLGPLFGGLVFERAGYDAVFAMAYGLIGVDLVLRFLMVERRIIPKAEDLEGAMTAEKKEMQLDEISSLDLKSPKTPVVSSFQWTDDKPTKPPPPALYVLITSRRLLSCLFGVMITSILMAQFDSVLPLYVKETFNWDSTAAGLIFLPITLTAFLSPIVGWGVDRYGARWFVTAGFVALAPFELLLILVTKNTLEQKVTLCVLLAFIGITFDMMIPPLLVEVTAVIAAKEEKTPGIFGLKGAMAQAYGLFNLAWALGSFIGPIWAGFVNERLGWATMAWSLSLLSFVSAIPMAVWTGGSILE